MNENLRNQITRYSFLLTVFVIWLHAGEPLISSLPGQVAVPGFFLLSGFLFFMNSGETVSHGGPVTGKTGSGGDPELETFCDPEKKLVPKWLADKLKRRIRTLLIPYLLWNLIYFLIYLAAGKAQFSEFFTAVFHYSCNPVFWYLYQLILITVLTPLLWLLLKRKGTAVVWLILVFLAAVFYGPLHRLIPVDLINADALFYYSLGGFSSLYLYKEKNVPEGVGPEGNVSEENVSEEGVSRGNVSEETVSERNAAKENNMDGRKFLIFAAGLLLSAALEDLLPVELINIGVIGVRVCGAAMFWVLLGLHSDNPVRPWMKISFFVYATHYMVIRAVWRAETALGLNGCAAANIVTYLLMPVFCFGAAWGLYLIMKKYTPKLLGLLTGGRG